MLNLQRPIFLGFPVSEAMNDALKRVNPSLLALFTQGGDDYLEEYCYQEQRYLGKAIGESVDTAKLRLVEANILSLLKRLLPDYPFLASFLVLIPGAVSTTDE